MPRLPVLQESDLERQMLRGAVAELVAGRHACGDCGRTPLVGETAYRYPRGEVVCALCRPSHTGEPVQAGLVHHAERGHSVRLRSPGLAA